MARTPIRVGRIALAVVVVAAVAQVELECHFRSCRLGISVAAELKQKLNRRSPDGLGFAMDSVLYEVGPLSPRRDALWDDHEISKTERALRWLPLRGAERAVTRWRLSRLDRENLIVMFDDRTRDVADQAAWNAAVLEKIRARRRS